MSTAYLLTPRGKTTNPNPNMNTTQDIPMNYENQDSIGMDATVADQGPGPRLMGADTLIGNDVYNLKQEALGDIKEIMLDVPGGRISYAVLSHGGLLGIGEKLFAVPWQALTLDTANKCFTLDVTKERLDGAPGFDKDHWPDMSDELWAEGIHTYYGTRPPVGSTLNSGNSPNNGITRQMGNE